MYKDNEELKKLFDNIENKREGNKGYFKSFLIGLKYVTIGFIILVLLLVGTYIILKWT